MDSDWVLRGIVGWDRIFRKMDATLSDGRPWIMGDNLTLRSNTPGGPRRSSPLSKTVLNDNAAT